MLNGPSTGLPEGKVYSTWKYAYGFSWEFDWLNDYFYLCIYFLPQQVAWVNMISAVHFVSFWDYKEVGTGLEAT